MIDWQSLGTIVAILISAGGFLLSWRRFPLEKQKSESEKKKTDSEAAGEITSGALALLTQMRARNQELEADDKLQKETIEELEETVDNLKRINATLNRNNSYNRARLEMLDDWTKRLMDQICEAGLEPVKMQNGEPKKKSRKGKAPEEPEGLEEPPPP